MLKPCADQGLLGNNLPWQSQWGRTLCQSLLQTRFCLETTSGRANGARPCAKALCRPGSAWKQPPLAEPMGQDLVPKPGADQVLPEPMGQELAHVLCSPGGIMSSFGTAKRGRPKTQGFPGKCLVNVLKVLGFPGKCD